MSKLDLVSTCEIGTRQVATHDKGSPLHHPYDFHPSSNDVWTCPWYHLAGCGDHALADGSSGIEYPIVVNLGGVWFTQETDIQKGMCNITWRLIIQQTRRLSQDASKSSLRGLPLRQEHPEKPVKIRKKNTIVTPLVASVALFAGGMVQTLERAIAFWSIDSGILEDSDWLIIIEYHVESRVNAPFQVISWEWGSKKDPP